jgi:hypothetical protein
LLLFFMLFILIITFQLVENWNIDRIYITFLFSFWIGTSSRSFFKGTEMWKEETLLKVKFSQLQIMDILWKSLEDILNSFFVLFCELQKEKAMAQTTFVNSRGERKHILSISTLCWIH